jgi:hypothetical protein
MTRRTQMSAHEYLGALGSNSQTWESVESCRTRLLVKSLGENSPYHKQSFSGPITTGDLATGMSFSLWQSQLDL